ncbi:MAG: CBS domain-containing protein [Phycisphaerales bacterium]|nr:CBS domain-containing protein [Phycisphaerales bacterium]
MSEVDAKVPAKFKRRPGPFGPAWALLPQGQEPLTLEDKTPASDAIERMVDNGFSQVPVTNREGRIIGVFSWQSFGKRVTDFRSSKIKATELPIREAMEPARFIGREVYIDTETDWNNVDYVLVGEDENLLGILCIADVFGRLNDFAEAFVLLYEIEHEIRDLIIDVVGQAGLPGLIGNMHTPPNAKTPQLLEEFTFSQYKSLICTKTNWPTFEPVFDSVRELVDADFGDVNELRNIVFHFRRGITPKDTDRLRRFRDRLRYNRELFARERAIVDKEMPE